MGFTSDPFSLFYASTLCSGSGPRGRQLIRLELTRQAVYWHCQSIAALLWYTVHARLDTIAGT